jgi:hypothetical protein
VSVKTDNPAEVGQHVFERAGLGLAPFRFVGFSTMIFRACPDAPPQPGTSCDYCGTGIMYVCRIKSADGKLFKVGCDCVNKTGEAGLIKAYKQSAEYRQHQRELRHAKDKIKSIELDGILARPEVKTSLSSKPHPNEYFAGKGKTYWDYIQYSLQCSGAAGRASWLKWLRERLDTLNRPQESGV